MSSARIHETVTGSLGSLQMGSNLRPFTGIDNAKCITTSALFCLPHAMASFWKAETILFILVSPILLQNRLTVHS